MNRDWNLSQVKRALLTVVLTLALVATVTHEHLMGYMWTVVVLVALIIVLQVVDTVRKERPPATPHPDAKVH